MTDEQARDEALTLLVAGHDSTAAGLTWACYALARNPGVAARATAEVDTVLSGRLPEYADVARLCYLEAVCKEAMRLYAPPFGVFRVAPWRTSKSAATWSKKAAWCR